MKRQNEYILKLLLLVGLGLTACVKNVVPPPDTEAGNEDPVFNEGFSLEFLASLDDLGDGLARPIDNYIDVEKFRVLFFTDDLDDTLGEDEKNVFLFESRTRFVRKHNESSVWRVSVPLFNYGNGVAAKWNWDELRKFFREHPFKIAILANRPESEWSMRIVGKTKEPAAEGGSWGDNEDDVIVPGSWYDNSAPHWDAINTLHGPSDGKPDRNQWKTLLDLHHVQYDPIYFGKSFDVSRRPSNATKESQLILNDGTKNPGRGKYYHDQNKIYDFVAEYDNDNRLMMGSTSSWVSWDGYDGELYSNSDIYGGYTWSFKSWDGLETSMRLFPPITHPEGNLQISTTSDGEKFYKETTYWDNNDGKYGTGRERLLFSFTPPAGRWQIIANVARQINYNDTPTLCLEVGNAKLGVPDQTRTISSTTNSDIYFDPLTFDGKTTVYVYAVGRTLFYSMGYMVPIDYNNRDPRGWKFRRVRHPDENYPIPMYGIQRFSKIDEDWDWGTPYNLTDKQGKSIYLLRSVVRLDLYVPTTMKVDFLTLFYSNIFSRCEPMDVWTPTDELWNTYIETGLEMKCIRQYGPIARSNESSLSADQSITRYQERMSWLYGIWTDGTKGDWKWHGASIDPNKWAPADMDIDPATQEKYHPHIFNPCVQRNTAVYCPLPGDPWGYTVKVDSDKSGFNKYVIYTGERNINDPSTFTEIGNVNGGKPTVAYFMIGINNSSYSIPLVNYSEFNGDSPVKKGKMGYSNNAATNNTPTNDIGNDFEQDVMDPDPSKSSNRPYPLIRNHVYQFTISGASGATRAGESGIRVSSAVRRSNRLRMDKTTSDEKINVSSE